MQITDKNIDVICQHTSDGQIIPIKIRLIDDDGEWQIFKIKSYKTLSCPGTLQMPNMVDATLHIWTFECRIMIFNNIKLIKLYYNTYDGVWKIINCK